MQCNYKRRDPHLAEQTPWCRREFRFKLKLRNVGRATAWKETCQCYSGVFPYTKITTIRM